MTARDDLSSLKRPDGTLTNDDEEKAEILRDHFAKTYPCDAEVHARNASSAPYAGPSVSVLKVNNVDTSPLNVHRHLTKLKRSNCPSPDDIPAAFWKSCGYEVCEPLSLILTRSLEEGCLPDIFKRAIIVPIHKKGDKSDPFNKRNVSLSCASCKIFESIIAETIMSNASCQNLLFENQYAYRKHRSCELQLLKCQNDLARLFDDNIPFDMVFFDFKSAFEVVTHSKLLKCLPNLGVGDNIISWIQAFLENRSFRVKVNEKMSSEASVTSGCPQGTVLGSLCYILYTNSVRYISVPDTCIVTYADDSKLFAKVENVTESENLQRAITKFFNWSRALDLNLSTNKCRVLHYGSKNLRSEYYIGDDKIEATELISDLGITTTTDFRFTTHIHKAVQNAARTSNWILRSLIVRDPDIYMYLFETFVLSKLLYASSVWRPQHKNEIKLLQRVCNTFRRRLAYKCNVPKEAIRKTDITQTLEKSDARIFQTILKHMPVLANEMFTQQATISRAKAIIKPTYIPRKELVNNLFPFRAYRNSR